MSDFPEEFRPVIVAPTFNNARTLPAVLRALDATGLAIIVVNDGSTDDTASMLASNARYEVVTHRSNLGKAAALHTGFDRARELRFTHAITIDTDGQHDVADITPLLSLAREHPNALVVGARPTQNGDYPARSFAGRSISNFFVKLESGATVADSQCGLRVYPLKPLSMIRSRAERYGFETEILARFAWAGLPIKEAPVRCIYEIEGGRTSHFRPIVDSIRAAGMHMKLLTRSLMPWPVAKIVRDAPTGTIAERFGRWMNPLRTWRDIKHSETHRKKFAASASLGSFVAVLPPLGLKTIACLALSRWLKLQPIVVIAFSSLNTPPIGTLLSIASIVTGHAVMHAKFPAFASYDPRTHGAIELLKSVGIEWALGSIVFGIVFAALTYVIARLAMKRMRDDTPEDVDLVSPPHAVPS